MPHSDDYRRDSDDYQRAAKSVPLFVVLLPGQQPQRKDDRRDAQRRVDREQRAPSVRCSAEPDHRATGGGTAFLVAE
jgi:hypothetical protein